MRRDKRNDEPYLRQLKMLKHRMIYRMRENLNNVAAIILFCLSFFSIQACGVSSKWRCDSMVSLPIALPNHLSVSNQFRLFWADLQNDLGNSPVEKYVPTDSFIEKYHLKLSDGEYSFSGFLKVSESFDPSSVQKINGTLHSYANGMYLLRVPIREVFALVLIKGINRIEIATQSYLK